jgi:hypothetical protein
MAESQDPEIAAARLKEVLNNTPGYSPIPSGGNRSGISRQMANAGHAAFRENMQHGDALELIANELGERVFRAAGVSPVIDKPVESVAAAKVPYAKGIETRAVVRIPPERDMVGGVPVVDEASQRMAPAVDSLEKFHKALALHRSAIMAVDPVNATKYLTKASDHLSNALTLAEANPDQSPRVKIGMPSGHTSNSTLRSIGGNRGAGILSDDWSPNKENWLKSSSDEALPNISLKNARRHLDTVRQAWFEHLARTTGIPTEVDNDESIGGDRDYEAVPANRFSEANMVRMGGKVAKKAQDIVDDRRARTARPSGGGQ